MSLAPGIDNPTIDNLVQSSLESENKYLRLEWIPCSQITHGEQTQIDNVYYAVKSGGVKETIMLSLLGSDEICTPKFVSEFARIYSLPTHKYNNDVSQYRRYSKWFTYRNRLIRGFTKYKDNYYMVADRKFYDCYSRYGFCTACGILRCSPVWCICGHKEVSNGWTSNNKQLDEFIKKSQLQTNSANQAYLEWIPFDCIDNTGYCEWLYGLPITKYYSVGVELTPLEITDDLYYDKLCNNVWITIGVTYDTQRQKYCLLNVNSTDGLCLACTALFGPSTSISAFCFNCKAPRPLDWTTGNKSLDSLIMESWKNIKSEYDAYIQWIEYSQLSNIQEMTLLPHRCTYIADWLELATNELTHVTLKKIVDEQNNPLFDFYQLTKEYPEMLTLDNIWIIGITREPSSHEYYLVFYHIHVVLDKIMRISSHVKYIPYVDFNGIKEIGSGCYATVYSAKYKKYLEEDIPQTVVLKRFKSFDGMPELFISKFRNHAKCIQRSYLLGIYGVTQDPETKEYMIVMQHANNGNLLSYLDQNINKLTWMMKLQLLYNIAYDLGTIHVAGFIHCDLHGGNIVLNGDDDDMTEKEFQVSDSYICDLGPSRESNSTIQGVLPFTAPEVFHTRKFTRKSDIYAFGIIMYLIASGEPPFRDRQFDGDLICDIMGGLRPSMPDSAPDEYKKLAERCCDADPDKRPDANTLYDVIHKLIFGGTLNSNAWETVYHNDVKPL